MSNKFFRTWAVVACCGAFATQQAQAQVTTNSGSGLAASYPSLAAAITALNGATISSPVVITLTGNETAPLGGYSITAQGTAANGITITGATSTITAAAAQNAGSLNDAIFKLVGADFITLQNFTMQENAANTVATAASNNMTEWGVALLYATTTNGSQNNTIQGNTISLNRTYTNTFGIYSNVRHSPTAPTTTADVTAASGANSNNKFYSNVISNVNYGLIMIGSAVVAQMDLGNDIGGAGAGTGNTFTNWGGASAASAYTNLTGSNYCIFMNHQLNSNVSFNRITSAAISGTTMIFGGVLFNYSTTAPTGTITTNVSNNTITLASANASGAMVGINTQGISTALANSTITLANNLIANSVISGAGSASGFTGITNASACGNLQITNNIVRGFTSTATSGGFTGVTNSGAVVNVINISNNAIGDATANAFTYSVASSGTISGILNSGAASTATLTIASNDLRGFVQNVTGSGTHTYITNSGTALVSNINSNTFTNIVANTTGSVTFIAQNFTRPANAVYNVNSNQVVTGYSKPGVGGTILFYSSNGSSPTSVVENNNNNNFSNITLTGAATVSGWQNTDGSGTAPFGSLKTINNNTFNNIVVGTASTIVLNIGFSNSTAASPSLISGNVISNITSAGQVTGIGSSGGTQNFVGNTIIGIASSGASVLTGFSVSGGAAQTISKNKIGDFSNSNAGGSIQGISISGGTTVNIINNIVGDLRTPAANSATDAIRGINITSTTATSTINVYYNTVFLAATSIGANFSTAAIFHTTSATATTAALDMRNNIFVNNSTANGTGNAVAYRRSSATLTNFSANSNRNDFFAPIIFADGTVTNATLAAYQGVVTPRDANSISVAPNFLSTTAATANFLHIDQAIATPLESGAAIITNISDDFDGDIRFGNAGYLSNGTAPDIGADEFGVTLTCSAAAAGTSSSSTLNYCSGQTASFANTGATASGSGLSYQWMLATTSGGPYSNVVGGTGATTFNYTSSALTAGVYYYVMRTSCATGSISNVSNEVAITVTANPTITVTPSSANYCNPGGVAVALTASGATTYSWAPAAGLSATTGTTVSATPAATTAYVVTGTTNGCTGTATANISVLPGVTLSPVTATPATVGVGGNSQISVTGSVTYDATAAAYAFTASAGTFTTITGTTSTLALGDDVTEGSLPIGFTFNYNGATHTTFAINSNGAIQLSSTGFGTLAVGRTNNLATSAARNVLAPLWDDNNTTGGSVVYATTGTAPNRVLTVQWLGMAVGDGGTGIPKIDMQARLYEANGVIEFVYGSTSAPFALTTASIGISGATGNFRSVTPLLPVNTSTSSTVTENSTINSATNFPSGTIYTFTPQVVPVITYVWSPATFLNNATIANPLASNVTITTPYAVTATNINGCFATGTTTVTVVLAFTAQASITSPAAVCQGASVNFTATPSVGTPPYTYAWSGPNGFSSTLQSPSITNVATAAAGIYTVTITDAVAATATASTASLTVNAAPALTLTQSSANYCNPGAGVSITAAGAVSYAWSPAAGLSAANIANPIATPAASTVYTVTGTGANSCTSVANVTVSSSPSVVVNPITATPASVCANGSSQLTVTAVAYDMTATPAMYTFAASSGVYAPITGTTLTLTDADDEVVVGLPIGFSFNYNGTAHTTFAANANGMISLSGISATLPFSNNLATSAYRNVIASLWDDNNMTGGSIIYATTGTAPNRVLTVQWTGMHVGGTGSSTAPTINTQIRLYEASGIVELVYGNTSAALGTSSASIGISGASGNFRSVTPLLPVNTSTSSTVTENAAINSASNFPSGTIYRFVPPMIAATSYAWSPATFLNSTTIANPLASNITTTTPYTVTATLGACSATANVTITAGAPLTLSTTITPAAVCVGGLVTLSSTPAGGGAPYTYAWSGPNAFSSTVQNPSFAAAAASAGAYSLTVSDACGASITSSTAVLTVNALPALTVTPANAVYCVPGTGIQLTAAGAASYAWTPAATLSASNIANPMATPTVSTVYTVVATGANGCTVSGTSSIAVSSVPALAAVTVTPSAVCVGANAQLAANAVVNTYAVTSITYASVTTPGTGVTVLANAGTTVTAISGAGSLDEGNWAGITLPFSFNFYGTPYTTLSASTNGYVVFGAGNVLVNGYAATYPSTAMGRPSIGAVASDLDFSNTGTINYFTTGTAPNRQFVINYIGGEFWDFAGSFGSVTTQIVIYETTNVVEVHTNNSTGDNVAATGIQNAAGTIAAVPAGRNTGTWIVATPEAFRFTPPVISYAWSPATFLSNTTIANPSVTAITSTTAYTVTATTSAGCTASTSATVTVNPTPALTITPASAAICAGNSTTLTATGANTYVWSNAVTNGVAFAPAATATYTVTGTDANGCTATRTATVTVNANPTVTTSTVASLCTVTGSATATAAAGLAPYTYLWSTTQTTATATGLAANTYTVTITDANTCKVTATAVVTATPSSLSATTATTQTTCINTNGTATVTASAGTTPYMYMWSNSATTSMITGLTAGNYTVTVMDASGCSLTSAVSVTTRANTVTAATTVTNVVCTATNGTATVSPAGGTAPYTLVWSNTQTTATATGLAAGSYTVTVTDANFCATTGTAAVTASAGSLSATTATTQTTCINTNGTATVTPAAGTAPYSILWSNGRTTGLNTGLTAGNYTVTVSDASGCSLTSAVSVTTRANTVTAATTVTNVICTATNGTATVSPAGGTAPYTLVWSNTQTTATATGLAAGSYTVTVTDANFCATTATAAVTASAGSLSTTTATTQTTCINTNGTATVTPAAGTAPYSILWSNGRTTGLNTGLTAGNYTVTVSDASGCSLTSAVSVTTRANTVTAATTVTNVVCTATNGTATVSPAGGTAPYTLVWSNTQTTATATGLAAGSYTVTVTDANFCATTGTAAVTASAGSLSAATATTPANCANVNGTATVTPSAGTAPYAILWSNGRTTGANTGLTAGNYTVTVSDASGCSLTSAVSVINTPNTLTLTTASVNANCVSMNGSASVSVTGGVSPFMYAWSSSQTVAAVTGLNAGTYSVTTTDANMCSMVANVTVNPTLNTVTATIATVNVSCNTGANGSVTVSSTGGTTPYTVLWSNGRPTPSLTGLTAGVYSVTSTDANMCTATATTTVTEPTALSFGATATAASCFGAASGSIATSATGGTPAYTYMWSNSQTGSMATGLVAGSYNVTLTDANGCQVTATAAVSQPTAALSSSNVVTNATNCALSDGQIANTAAGGTAPYMYMWTGARTGAIITGLNAGIYNGTITDANGCSVTTAATVTAPSTLTITASSTNIGCFGVNSGSATATPAGGTNPYTYMWSNNQTTQAITGLAVGTYTVTVMDNGGCVGFASATVSTPSSALTITASGTNASCAACVDGSASASAGGGTAPYTFRWSNSATTSGISGLAPGTYTVTATDANGCTASIPVNISAPVGVEEVAGLNIRLFPNPTKSMTTIDGLPANGMSKLTLINSLGQTLWTVETNQTTYQVNLETLAPAMYFIQIQTEAGKVTKPVTKTE